MQESYFFTHKKRAVTLTEVNQYLMKYPTHSITTRRVPEFDQSHIFFTEHVYPNGLIIYLKWEAKTDYLEDEFPTLHLLFTLRNRGFYVPKGFDIIVPNETNETNEPFDYQALEHQTSSPVIHSDEVFTQLTKDIENLIRFEEYYKKYKKNNG